MPTLEFGSSPRRKDIPKQFLAHFFDDYQFFSYSSKTGRFDLPTGRLKVFEQLVLEIELTSLRPLFNLYCY